jgi:hypothetical protein
MIDRIMGLTGEKRRKEEWTEANEAEVVRALVAEGGTLALGKLKRRFGQFHADRLQSIMAQVAALKEYAPPVRVLCGVCGVCVSGNPHTMVLATGKRPTKPTKRTISQRHRNPRHDDDVSQFPSLNRPTSNSR